MPAVSRSVVFLFPLADGRGGIRLITTVSSLLSEGRRAADLSPAAATVIGSIGCVAALVRPSPRWLRLSIRAPREIVASL